MDRTLVRLHHCLEPLWEYKFIIATTGTQTPVSVMYFVADFI